jgi:hypothetical protein
MDSGNTQQVDEAKDPQSACRGIRSVFIEQQLAEDAQGIVGS